MSKSNLTLKEPPFPGDQGLEQRPTVGAFQQYPPPQPAAPSIAANVASELGSAFANAAKARAAREVNAQLVGMVKRSLGDRIPQDNPMVDAALGIGVPVILLYGIQALTQSGNQAVPPRLLEGVQKASTYALQGVSQNMVDQVVDQALPMLREVAALGAGLMMQGGELGEGGQPGFLQAGEDIAHEAKEEEL